MNNKLKRIQSEISSGELLDKISILEIKLKKIKDKENLKEINKEYAILKQSQNLNIKLTNELKDLFDELKKVNLNLWDIEDKLRICEKNKDFGEKFIELARGVYFNNDSRAKIKSEINKLSGSNIKEIKQYSDY
jgi:predicted nuclease with TOPRIM domain|tara:strand:- start:333 stop:734 length:402 start_codon:yes stop_codon:yes gene_type:complete